MYCQFKILVKVGTPPFSLSPFFPFFSFFLQNTHFKEVEEEQSAARRDEHHHIIEFAENFFNDHEKSPSGTIVGTIKRSKVSISIYIYLSIYLPISLYLSLSLAANNGNEGITLLDPF